MPPKKKTKDLKPPRYRDAIDIPVLFRDGPGGRTRREWRRTDHGEWKGVGFPSKDGWYLPTTTWREILHAAISVGRDISPWLDRPHYAVREIGARVAPLDAYLDLHDAPSLHHHNAGRRLTANVVLEQGTESSAFGAFSYRLGMTMTEWACRSLMGLGETWHIENSWPEGIKDPADGVKAVKGQKNPRPDLWGKHLAESRYWLIEAKGGTITPGRLDRGWKQVQGGCSVLHPHGLDHRLVLCGTGIKRGVSPANDVFVIIRHEHHPGTPPSSGSAGSSSPLGGPQSAEEAIHEDDTGSALLDAARAKMLPYLVLRSLQQSSFSRLRLVPVSQNRTWRRPQPGRLTLMEDDGGTREQRDALRRRTSSPTDADARQVGLEGFLTARVPHTEVTLGMSRQLYSACAELFQADREIATQIPGLRAEDHSPEMDDHDLDARSTAVRREYRERQEEARPHLQRRLRAAFSDTRDQPWEARLGDTPGFTIAPAALEATTPETYLSINPDDLLRR
ncbi:gamma-glutamyltransferase [Streptomyces jumonjinensis]|uniref:gamma-glutamyltransferase n=1 Tax=Streptomyces jumonjinensis TaxID=1945 RepID=UPI00378C7226